MDTTLERPGYTTAAVVTKNSPESSASGVSWGAVIAGAFAAAAVSMLLMVLGSGIGLLSASPMGDGASAAAIGIGAGIWLIVVQWLGSAMGGYIAGRLRTKWAGVHTDEVFFRDTAHGFLAWAVATVLSAAVVIGAAGAIAGGAASAVATVAGGAAQGASQGAVQAAANGTNVADPGAYFTDLLFRPAAGTTAAPQAAAPGTVAHDTHGEAARILATSALAGEMKAEDRTYLASLIAKDTGMSQADAERRVDDVVAQTRAAAEKAKQVADDARKAAAGAAMLGFLALLIGAFIACAAAALGGRQRDEIEAYFAAR